jgi:hypothetical protein
MDGWVGGLVGLWMALGRFQWSSGRVLATGPKIRGFKPGRRRWILRTIKHPYHDFLWRGSKDVGPMS